MIKAVKNCDQVMFFGLLILVIFIPYSSAMIQGSLFLIMLAWLSKHIFLWKNPSTRNSAFVFNFPFKSIFLPLVLISLLILLTIPWSHAPVLSLKKFFSRFVQQVFLMYVTVEIINSSKRLYLLMTMLLWTLLVVNADVVFQIFSGKSFIFSNHMIFERVSGPMRHPNDLGTVLITVIPIMVILMMTRSFWVPIIFPQKFQKSIGVCVFVLLVLSLIALGLTSSRGAWVGFVVSMVGASIYLRKKRWIVMVGLFLVFFIWVSGIHFANTRSDIFIKETHKETHKETPKEGPKETYKEVHEAVVENKSQAQYPIDQFFTPSRRIQYWKTASSVIKEYPWFGCGYNAYIQTLLKLNREPVEYPHNGILHIAAELGLIGLLLYIFFFVGVFYQGLKILKSVSKQYEIYLLGVSIFFGLIAWLIHCFLDTPWESLQLSILWWLLIGVLMSLNNIAVSTKVSTGGK